MHPNEVLWWHTGIQGSPVVLSVPQPLRRRWPIACIEAHEQDDPVDRTPAGQGPVA
jgi:hypothetical protein